VSKAELALVSVLSVDERDALEVQERYVLTPWGRICATTIRRLVAEVERLRRQCPECARRAREGK